jgi:hypothetical protein
MASHESTPDRLARPPLKRVAIPAETPESRGGDSQVFNFKSHFHNDEGDKEFEEEKDPTLQAML